MPASCASSRWNSPPRRIQPARSPLRRAVSSAASAARICRIESGVAAGLQRRGLGRYLLDKAAARARGLGMASILLEVRPSNVRALDVYRRYGYAEIGRRRAYYPAHQGQREDAIVMRYTL